MKRFLSRIAMLALAVMAVSCGKDTISPEELFQSGSNMAKTKISLSKDFGGTEETASFATKAVYRKSEFPGQSWLSAFSGGKMVYDIFYLSLYFQDVEKMKVGETLKPSRTMFSFIASSASNATTFEYSGKITLADKGEDYVILSFHKVTFKCSMGTYVTDGYLYCELKDEFEIPEDWEW